MRLWRIASLFHFLFLVRLRILYFFESNNFRSFFESDNVRAVNFFTRIIFFSTGSPPVFESRLRIWNQSRRWVSRFSVTQRERHDHPLFGQICSAHYFIQFVSANLIFSKLYNWIIQCSKLWRQPKAILFFVYILFVDVRNRIILVPCYIYKYRRYIYRRYI